MTVFNKIRYEKCPNPALVEGLQRYIEHGIESGGFLMALLEGNLYEAVQRADAINQMLIVPLVVFITNEMPWGSYGSPALVERWMSEARAEARNRAALLPCQIVPREGHVYGWCETHNVEENAGHAFDKGRVHTLD